MKYSRFLWSVQISTRVFIPSRKWHYSSSTSIMASIFLLFCFTSKSDLLKHVTRYYLPLSVDIWERTTSITKLKLSVSMQNSIEVLEKTRIEVEVIAILSVLQV